jgi:hypothetical protein
MKHFLDIRLVFKTIFYQFQNVDFITSCQEAKKNSLNLFSPIPPHFFPHPGCGRNVTDFWGWGAHRAQLRCPDNASDDLFELGTPGGALNLNSTRYPDDGRYGYLTLQGKIPTEESGIKPGTSWLVVWSSDHQTTRLIALLIFCALFLRLFVYLV